MIILFISLLCIAVLYTIGFLNADGPTLYRSDQPDRDGPKSFIRSSFRKLSQRQLLKDDRRLFAAGDRRAFA